MRGSVIVLITVFTTLSLSLLAFIVWQSTMPRVQPVFQPESAQPTSMDTRTIYSAQDEIRANMRKLQQGPGMAKVVTESDALDKKIALTIDGMLDDVTMLQILDILKRYDMTASFFISGMQASSEPEVVKALAEAKQVVGNYTLRAKEHMEAFTQTELVEDFSISSTIFVDLLGTKPSQLKGNVTEYDPAFLEAAQACGLTNAVKSSAYLTYHSFRSYDEVQAYVDKLPYRSIVSIKLSGKLDPSEYTPKEVIEQPAIDLQPGAEAQKQEEPLLTNEERLLRMVEWLMQALEHANFSPETVKLRQLNEGKLADPQKGLNTTEAVIGYAFCGLGRVDELLGALDFLEAAKGVGTFFVTGKEIEDYPALIDMVISRGHSVGIAAYPKKDDDFYTVCHNLFYARQLLEQHGYQGVQLVMQPWGEIGDELREAVSAMNCTLISYDIAFMRSDNQNARNAQEVIDSVYKENTYGFRRGSVIFFRMNYFDRSGLLAELLKKLEGTRNTYPIKDIFAMWNNSEEIYTYPLPAEDILPEVRGRIYPGQLSSDVMEYVKTHYIGNKDIAYSKQLPDFTPEEIRTLDKTGKIKGSGTTAFLTFDDWGSDINLTKLLDVLEKHNVKATFFIRTEFVPDNPNLLRAIALAGHEIASHTHTHMPLAHDPEGKWRFTPITQEEALALQDDLVQSYNVLESIVGDIRLDNGKPALSCLFRPPTMAVSRAGIWAAFDCGFTYIVNGAYTSRDYAAESADKLARELRSNVRAGMVVILHMSDNSIHTADALDQYLTQMKKNPDTALHFARLSDYLGGVSISSQLIRGGE